MEVQQEAITRKRYESRSQVNGQNGHAKGGKASFDHIYNEADPRPYFQTLDQFDYQIPAHGQSMFTLLVDLLRRQGEGDDLTVLDLCCSYGINAALLNHDLSLGTLYERYRSAEVAALSSHELAVADTEFYSARRRRAPLRVIGVDTADRAVAYGAAAGLLAGASAENLEQRDPSQRFRHQLSDVKLVTVTGGIGYISERTFDRVLQATARAPWVAAFALRWVSYEPIAAVLSRHGLVTEKLEGRTFVQRNFANEGERAYVLDELARLGIDPIGKEAEGQFHAEFYLSRPAAQQEAVPLEQIAAGI